jgi:hypothetical protein
MWIKPSAAQPIVIASDQTLATMEARSDQGIAALRLSKNYTLAAAFAIATPAAADILTVGYSTGGPIATLGTSPDGSQLQFLNTAAHPLLLNDFGFAQIITLLIPPSMSSLGDGSAPTFAGRW